MRSDSGGEFLEQCELLARKRRQPPRPLYRSVQPQSKTPTIPLSTEAEMLIPGNVRLKIIKIREENLERGKRVTITCEEED